MNGNEHKAQRGLSITIEGKLYNWEWQFITGHQIKELANLKSEDLIYLSVPSPWKDEYIGNEIKVDLARPEIEHFYVRNKLAFKINGGSFESTSQYITGKEIRNLAGIVDGDEIFLRVDGPWEDEKINNDANVDLARPGVEQFYSVQSLKLIELIVNGRLKNWENSKITYKQVVELAFGEEVAKETRVYSVSYKRGPEQNTEGTMVAGNTVFVKNKMIFNVTCTDKS
jgi:hypothetical protein